jgi:putative MATE family efflux protein
MTTAPVERLVVSLALPSIAIMIITSLYNMADTYFVSYLGTSQVAAVGIAFPLMAIIQAMGFFFGQGSGNFMSRALGAQNTEEASRMAVTGLLSGILVMALIAVTGLANLELLIDGLGATVTIKPFARDYLFYILLASPWMVGATVLNQQLRFQGSASIAMVGMLTGAILNMFLDPVFIFVFGLGVGGAAIATMLCQITSFLILLLYGCRRRENIPIKLSHFSPSWKLYKEMFRGGIPSLIRQGLNSTTFIIINHFARAYGDAAIAAISIVQRLQMFASSVILGIGQGFQPLCGFNYGAKLYSRVRKAYWFCVKYCCFGLVVMSLLMAIFAPQLIALFRKDDLEVIAIGARGLRLHCVSLPLSAFIVMSNMMTQTMGMAMETSIVSLSRQGLFLIPSLFILGPLLGLFGIQMAAPASDFACLVIVIPLIKRILKTLSASDAPAAEIPVPEIAVSASADIN